MHIQTERVLHKHHKVLILGRLRRNAAAKKKKTDIHKQKVFPY